MISNCSFHSSTISVPNELKNLSDEMFTINRFEVRKDNQVLHSVDFKKPIKEILEDFVYINNNFDDYYGNYSRISAFRKFIINRKDISLMDALDVFRTLKYLQVLSLFEYIKEYDRPFKEDDYKAILILLEEQENLEVLRYCDDKNKDFVSKYEDILVKRNIKLILSYINHNLDYLTENFFIKLIENKENLKSKKYSIGIRESLLRSTKDYTNSKYFKELIEILDDITKDIDVFRVEQDGKQEFYKFLNKKDFYCEEDFEIVQNGLKNSYSTYEVEGNNDINLFTLVKPGTDSFKSIFYHFFFSKRINNAKKTEISRRFEEDVFKGFCEIIEKDLNAPLTSLKKVQNIDSPFCKRLWHYMTTRGSNYPKIRKKVTKLLINNL